MLMARYIARFDQTIIKTVGMVSSVDVFPFYFLQRAAAAFCAISLRRSLVKTLERAAPPLIPPARLPWLTGDSSISPVAIFIVMIAQATVPAGRFCPCGPVGMMFSFSLLLCSFITRLYLWYNCYTQ